MSKIQSHVDCSHESSKAARAKCRRSRAKFADAFTALLAEPEMTIIQSEEVAVPSEEEEFITVEAPEEPPSFIPERVTAENWKEYKETPVRITFLADEETESEIASGVLIVGWGKRWIDYRRPDGEGVKRTSGDWKKVMTMES
jgi:hypothetical protein